MVLGFWGLTILPDKTYTQIVDSSFKVSMAALDEQTKPGRTSVRVSVDKKSLVLCSLTSGKVDQQKVDLIFTEGEEITFSVTGDNIVHLSGNYLPDDVIMGGNGGVGGDDDDDEEDDDIYSGYDQDEDGNIMISQGTKRLADLIGDEAEDEDSEDDPDFTGEDDDEDEDDSEEDDDEESSIRYGAQAEDDVDDSDDDENEDQDKEGKDDSGEDEDDSEDSSENSEDDEPVPVKKETAPAVKKQKVSEEKAVIVKPKQEAAPAKAQEAKEVKEVKAVKEEVKKQEAKKQEIKKGHKKTLPNGMIIEDIKVGDGSRAKSGKKIGMRYIGRLQNGKVFDKNTSGKPFKFELGAGEVIKGWDLGILGMKIGGERRLTIPPSLAYGSQGCPPDIPQSATLVFEVKLLSMK
ncbi:peptidylprolyl isomerase fpr4 [Mortierella sp. AD031]|nr:peptidylprolyl isomerase fpr4 [Mortierella sp. AD031]KAG0220337.1 peptidylprolyl isomerase fpr4 [Mortierella sp. NVP41]